VLAVGHLHPDAGTTASDAVDRSRALDHPVALALALNARAQFQYHNNEWEAARRDALEALGFYERANVLAGIVRALITLGLVAEHDVDRTEADRFHQRALEIARRTGEANVIAATLDGLADVTAARGHGLRARGLLDEAAAMRENAGRSPTPLEQHDIARVLPTINHHLDTCAADDEAESAPRRER
jgi:tetratricopeptide (TPR) repeat protein